MKHSKYAKVRGKYVEWAAWILKYEQYNYSDDLEKVSDMITRKLSLKYCPPQFRENNLGNALFGHCYHATQALYYFFKDANLQIMSAPCDIAGSHWWLQDGDKKIDITADQYYSVGKTPPYDKGKKSNWYGWKNRPHRKSQKLMREVQPSSELVFKKYMKKPKQSY
jgi:hypothetical protein